MVRYLLELGRETGQGRHWTRALAMFDALLGRLSHLGLSLRSVDRGMNRSASSRTQAEPRGDCTPC